MEEANEMVRLSELRKKASKKTLQDRIYGEWRNVERKKTGLTNEK